MSMKRRIQIAAAGLAVGAASMIGAGTALAQEGDDPYLAPTSTVAPEVLGVQEEQGEVLGVQEEQGEALSAGAAAADAPADTQVQGQVQGSALAFTGGDALGMALIGGVAVAGGAGLVLARRRSTRA